MGFKGRRGGKPDTGDKDMVKLARELHATVEITSRVGFGFPDWVMGARGHTFLVERKSRGGQLQENQVDFRRRWEAGGGGPFVVIETPEQLIAMLTAPDILAWVKAHMAEYDREEAALSGTGIAGGKQARRKNGPGRPLQRPPGFRFADELPFGPDVPDWT